MSPGVKRLLLLLLSGLGAAAACGDHCGKDQNVGGGRPAFATVMHVRVTSPQALSTDARRDIAELLNIDEPIIAQTEIEQPLHVVVGAAETGVEIYTALRAAPGAQRELGKRYEMETLMFRQVRIKPNSGRARCMLISDHIGCALGDARLGRGVFEVERLARPRDAGLSADVVLFARVLKPAAFGTEVVPLARARVERAMTRAKAEQSVRDKVLGRWDAVAEALSSAQLIGRVEGDTVTLHTSLAIDSEDYAGTVDLGVVGVDGKATARVSRGGDGRIVVVLEMSRAAMLSCARVLARAYD